MIERLFIDQARFMSTADLQGLVSLYHRESPSRELVEKQMTGIFQRFRLAMTLLDFSVLHEADECIVKERSETRAVSGGEFRDNVVTNIHILKMDAGEWKIFASIIMDIKYI